MAFILRLLIEHNHLNLSISSQMFHNEYKSDKWKKKKFIKKEINLNSIVNFYRLKKREVKIYEKFHYEILINNYVSTNNITNINLIAFS